MKDDTILLLGALSIVYVLNKKDTTPAPTDSYAGSTPLGFTSSDVTALKGAGLTNAQVVEAALNPPKSYTVISSKGKTRTLSTAPAGATKTSLNGNQYLAPRVGGGYRTVGAKNIVLR